MTTDQMGHALIVAEISSFDEIPKSGSVSMCGKATTKSHSDFTNKGQSPFTRKKLENPNPVAVLQLN